MMNLLDTRELGARLQELEEAEESELSEDDLEELEALRGLKNEVYGFEEGVMLIEEDDFGPYIQDFCHGLSDIPGYLVIDWEATVRSFKTDYSSVSYLGTDYYYRAL